MKDFSFIVQCNERPATKVNVVAESFDEAKKYAKSMYAMEHTTYADDRLNNWLIKEV